MVHVPFMNMVNVQAAKYKEKGNTSAFPESEYFFVWPGHGVEVFDVCPVAGCMKQHNQQGGNTLKK